MNALNAEHTGKPVDTIDDRIALHGRVALVTGGASGIGLAVVQRLVAHGATVVIADRADADHLPAAARPGTHAAGTPGVAAYVRGDVREEADITRMVDTAIRCAQTGGLVFDTVVTCAGIADQLVPTIEQDADVWQKVLDVSLRGTYLTCRAAGRHMLPANRGTIVNISSLTSLGGFPRRTAYGPAKAAVANLTRALACEWGGSGIRVNCIAPGYIATPLVDALCRDDKIDLERLQRRTPMARLGQPDEIAKVVAFLVSDLASFVSGVELPVDGGWSAFGGSGDVATA
ncbi:SDR family NAD(P)-dependent oxidoreductase [Pandoraea pnomenusa]|uniref:SDR family NAD(P)-dependent oxidoreductase n=1 Tax=Pandoraea pnomenusa TaxID=93220 RepID=UPI0033429BAF